MSGRGIAGLPNLGPATARLLAEIGIHHESDLRAVGAVEAWRRLKFHFPRQVTLNALYGMEAALRGCHWNALPSDVKAELQDVVRTYGRRS